MRVSSQPCGAAHATAAERLIEDDFGIDHQAALAIVGAGPEPNVIGGVDPIYHVDRLIVAANNLIGHRLGLMDLSRANAQNEIPVRIDPNLVNALETELDSSRIAPGSDFEIVFEVLLVSSKYQIDARIDSAPADSAVEVVGSPDIAAEEVVRPTWHTIESFQ